MPVTILVTLRHVRVISKAAIIEFARNHKDALEPLLHCYLVAKRAQWQSLVEVREDFRHADAVDVFTIFNIGGNKYRLVTAIKYRWQVIYVRDVLTHAEYSKEKWKS